MIIGYRMKCTFIYPTIIIAMDYFSHEPEIWFYFVGNLAQTLHIVEIQDISCIKTDSIDIEFTYPETNNIADIILYCWIVLI